MGVLDAYAVEGFLEWLVSLVPLATCGFLLAMLFGVAAFGVFKLLGLLGFVSR